MEASSINILLALRSGSHYFSNRKYHNYYYRSWSDTYSYYIDDWNTNNRDLGGLILKLSYNIDLINKKYYSQNIKIYSELNLLGDDTYITLGISSEFQLGILKYFREKILNPRTTIL